MLVQVSLYETAVKKLPYPFHGSVSFYSTVRGIAQDLQQNTDEH